MGHRLNLLKVLNRDLFIVKEVESPSAGVNAAGDGEQAQPTSTIRHLALEIFEVPKGVRVFPMILRFLFPVSLVEILEHIQPNCWGWWWK